MACSRFPTPPARVCGGPMPGARVSLGWRSCSPLSGRLSSFAALPNEGAPMRLRWAEYLRCEIALARQMLASPPISSIVFQIDVSRSQHRVTMVGSLSESCGQCDIVFEFAHSLLYRMHSREVGSRGRPFGSTAFSLRGSVRISYAEGRGASLFARKCGRPRGCRARVVLEASARV